VRNVKELDLINMVIVVKIVFLYLISKILRMLIFLFLYLDD